MSSVVSPPSTIVSAIRPAFEKGKASGDLLFFPSEVHTHKDLGIDVGLFSFPFPRYYSSNDITSTVVRDKIVSGALEETHVADATL